MKSMIAAALGVALLVGSAVVARAGETAPAAMNPALMITNVLRQPVDYQQRQVAYDESIRQAGPAPANRALGGEVQPDGSVRYGDVTVSSIKNPCPPGEHVELPSPLPRRARK